MMLLMMMPLRVRFRLTTVRLVVLVHLLLVLPLPLPLLLPLLLLLLPACGGVQPLIVGPHVSERRTRAVTSIRESIVDLVSHAIRVVGADAVTHLLEKEQRG